jgi:prepilin-type N-terminal cleavage/methylation domain-containing protein
MRRAFTLIELLVVIAIVAILAAILFPVFAQAKTSAKVASALSSVKQLGIAVHIYAADVDDMAVPEYGSRPYTSTDTWVGKVMPYIKNRQIFWDPTRPHDRKDVVYDPYYRDNYRWEWAVNLSLNTDGFSRHWTGNCQTVNWSGPGTYRSLSTISEPASRLMVSPVQYGRLDYGWMRFFARDASWPEIDVYVDGWSWNNLVWDARRFYPNSKFVGAYTDGHAAKFGREKFVAYSRNASRSEANTVQQYCQKMDERGLWEFWGRSWSGD